MTLTKANRHPVDQLADVRAEMAALKAIEERLREALMAPRADLVGEDHIAQIKRSEVSRIVPAKVREMLSAAQLAKVSQKSPLVVVKTLRRSKPNRS